jgi:hypothetical protein
MWNLKEAGGKIPNRGTRTTSGILSQDEFANQNEVPKLPGGRDVNVAVTWEEGYTSYQGRSHGRAEEFIRKHGVKLVVRSQQTP